MDSQSLLDLLNNAGGSDWTIVFNDGDAYPLSSLDVHQEVVDPHGEIDVAFRNCLHPSQAQREADARHGEQIPDVWYQHGKPVGKTYCVTEIQSIFDNVGNKYLLEPESPTRNVFR